eukprot:scaffold125543_cov31-Attheya_sp.AAC.1
MGIVPNAPAPHQFWQQNPNQFYSGIPFSINYCGLTTNIPAIPPTGTFPQLDIPLETRNLNESNSVPTSSAEPKTSNTMGFSTNHSPDNNLAHLTPPFEETGENINHGPVS